jgi:hypothetical protein
VARLERDFQPKLIEDLEHLFPKCVILKNDPNYRQGIPDLLILWRDHWALLEVKKSYQDFLDKQQPNQEYYVNWAQENSFGAFIYPENKTEVLQALVDFFNR